MKLRTKVITGIVRLSYVYVWEPHSVNGGPEKYSVSIIIPKDDLATLKKINDAVDAAIEEGLSNCLFVMVTPREMTRPMLTATS